jgi:hypothetical protein
MLLLYFLVLDAASASAGGNFLYTNEYLVPGQMIFSQDGLSRLVFQTDGNICAIDKLGSRYWCSNAVSPYASTQLIMQSDCNFVAYSDTWGYWSTKTQGQSTNCYITILDDRDVIVYSGTNVPLWSCCNRITDDTQPVDDDPQPPPDEDDDALTTFMFTFEYLTPGEMLWSPNSLYYLIYQTDGNLCAYEKGTSSGLPYWCTNVFPEYPPDRLIMEYNCNLVAYSEYDLSYWTSWTSGLGSNCYLTIQDDQNVVIYGSDGKPKWDCGCDTASLKDDGIPELDDGNDLEGDDDALKDDVLKDDDDLDVAVTSMSFTTLSQVSGVTSSALNVNEVCKESFKNYLFLVLGGYAPMKGISIESLYSVKPNGSNNNATVVRAVYQVSDAVQRSTAEPSYASLISEVTSVPLEFHTYLLRQLGQSSGCSLFRSASITSPSMAFSVLTLTGSESDETTTDKSNGNSDKALVLETTGIALITTGVVVLVVVAVVIVVMRRRRGDRSHTAFLTAVLTTEDTPSTSL